MSIDVIASSGHTADDHFVALCISSTSSSFDIQDNFPRHSFGNPLHSSTMIPSARRLQGRFIFFSAVASLFLLSLFLWRTADPRVVDPRLSAAVKQTISNEHSSHSLIHDSDEYLDDYESLTHSQDEHIDLKPTPIVHPFTLSLPPASSSISTSSSSAVQSHDAVPTEPARTPAANASPSTYQGNPINTSQNPRISGKPNNLTISGFVFYGRRDRTESMHCYLEVYCIDSSQEGRLLIIHREISSRTADGWIM